MLTVNPLSPQEIQTLEEMHKNHASHAPRIRAHAILLSDTGFKLTELARIYNICRQTAATWLHAWKDGGICALFDKPRSGRPHILCNEAEVDAITRVNQSPRSLKKVLAELTASLDLTISPSLSTLKRVCKRAGLNWKRIRKSLRSKRDPDLFEQSRQQLVTLIEQSKQKEIDLFYFDESGFTLEPCVPYAWQPRGETIEVPCAKSKRLNVLGFVNRECSFTSVVFEGSVTSAVVVASIDHFISTLQRQTTLVMDNASIHKSLEFQENIEHWQQLGLTIVNIAPYSPELNIIEIVWRKIKYEWIPFSAYESFQNLKESLFDILANIGKSYTVNFA
ncbi:MAG: IS630 family transposase [Methylococcaceae bacterium]|jgi:transposase|nr:IS630 family transposase [Methylococcaceae bacterium]